MEIVVRSFLRSALSGPPLVGLPLLIVLATAGCDSGPPPDDVADLVLVNGKVVTVDPGMPEAQAVAVKDGRILMVGSDDEIRQHHVGAATEVIDLDGQLAVPGFIEGHGHFTSLGNARMILDLTTATSWEDIVQMVAQAVAEAEPGAWIQGRGWHQEKWSAVPEPNVDGVPLHDDLSAVSPDNPVFLGHASGHAAFVNSRAMALAGIGADTPDPEGGTIVKDGTGAPTGLLRENADELATTVLNAWLDGRSDEQKAADARRVVELAGADALSKGVTSFHDAGSDFATIDLFKTLADEGALPIRLYVMVRFESNEAMDRHLPDYRMIGYGEDFLTVRSIKRQIDGALGSHGAWLLEPYADLDSRGLNLEPIDEIEETVRIALEHGFQVNTHAIGDRANREVLDIYERGFQAAGVDPTGLRWRIEHAQHVHPDDVDRFALLGLIASMQGIHCTSDAPWVLKRLGEERARTESYLWRTFHEAGVLVTNGTDVPVEDIDPLASFYASVTRRTADGSVFYGDQVMTREEALRSYTINNAYASFEEDLKGSIVAGKLADITVLDRDIMTIPAEEILDTDVVYTIVGGEVRYRR
jgi:predicted amidohydrolase YtcJ